jgi:serine/threonine protein kinase
LSILIPANPEGRAMSELNLALWTRLSPLLDRALDLELPERDDFLAAVRADDSGLAAALEQLLTEHQRLLASDFLETPPLAPKAPLSMVGQTVGGYTLVRPLGIGGMGTVWLARRSDGRFDASVAVKFVNLAALDGLAHERFRREATLLARLSHPQIARLLDAGVTPGGQPYLVLEYIEGTRLDRHADEQRLDVRARLALFLQVADAVTHAHAHLVVHRDLKPSNILVDAEGRVKLLDFGIATLLAERDDGAASVTVTLTGAPAFTPEYAAPEQVQDGAITTATDVYALGVLLYQLLVGAHPTAKPGAAHAEVLRSLTDDHPRALSDVARGLSTGDVDASRVLAARRTTRDRLRLSCRGDLDTIAARALKKRADERYQTVSALAADIRAHLNHEPVSAQPDSLWYRTRKLVARRPLETALAFTTVLALVVGGGAALWQARTATAERDFARRQLARSQAINELNEFLLSDAAPVGRPLTAGQVLARAERVLERQQSGSLDTRVSSLVTIGRQYASQDDDSDALRVLEQAYALSRSVTDPSVRARAACALAGVLATVGTDARPPSLLREAIAELPETQPFALDRVFCQLQAGTVERFGAAPAASIEHVKAAQAMLATSGVTSAVLDLRAAIDLAESYRTAGRGGEASVEFARAWEKLREQGRDDTETAGTLLNNWALARSEQPIEAEPLLRRAIEIASADGSEASVSPMLLTNMAWTLLDLGRVSESIAVAERAGVAAGSAGAGAAIFRNQLLRARLYVEAGDIDRSAVVLDEFERRAPELVPPGHNAFAVLEELRGRIAAARGERDQARTRFDRALALLDPMRPDLRPFRWRIFNVRAVLALREGRIREAVADAERAVALAREIVPGTTPGYTLGRAQLLLGQALHADGRTDEAGAALTQAVHHLEGSVGAAHPGYRAARDLLDAKPAR